MKTAVVVFPGSNCDRDVQRAISESLESHVEMIWHEETDIPDDTDLVVLPGGFSYGDYLRSGAMASCSPIIGAIKKHASKGKLLLGICNGFQVLTETGLLPGALLANTSTTFICSPCYIRVETTNNSFTANLIKDEILQFPIAHHEGLYFLPPKELEELEKSGCVVFRYADPKTGKAGQEFAPNGAENGIAGICNKQGNILGLMPHPERATIKHLNGGTDGVKFWQSIAKTFTERGTC